MCINKQPESRTPNWKHVHALQTEKEIESYGWKIFFAFRMKGINMLSPNSPWRSPTSGFLYLIPQITDGPALTAQVSNVPEEGLNHGVVSDWNTAPWRRTRCHGRTSCLQRFKISSSLPTIPHGRRHGALRASPRTLWKHRSTRAHAGSEAKTQTHEEEKRKGYFYPGQLQRSPLQLSLLITVIIRLATIQTRSALL